MSQPNYHVGAGIAGIYAGVLQKDGRMWMRKSSVTDEAINSVRDYMIQDCLGGYDCSKAANGGYMWTLKDGRTVELTIKIKD